MSFRLDTRVVSESATPADRPDPDAAAAAHDLTGVTRNGRTVAARGARVLNPYDPQR